MHSYPNTHDPAVNLNDSNANTLNRSSTNQIGENLSNNEQDKNVAVLPLSYKNCEVR